MKTVILGIRVVGKTIVKNKHDPTQPWYGSH